MIEAKLNLTGRVTGFRTGDKTIDLSWRTADATGRFDRLTLNKDTPLEITVPKKTTVLIFSPGEIEDTRQQTVNARKTELENKTMALEEFEGSDTDKTRAEEALATARDALKTAEDALKEEPANVIISLIVGGSGPGLIIANSEPTILSFDGKTAQTFKLSVNETIPGCELVIL